MRLAIIGASGAVGATLAAHVLRARLLQGNDVLQLVGHGPRGHGARLLATQIDLQDAFNDDHVAIELVPDLDGVSADIVIVASGATVSPSLPTRRDVGRTNCEIFRHIAETCAARLPQALFVDFHQEFTQLFHFGLARCWPENAQAYQMLSRFFRGSPAGGNAV